MAERVNLPNWPMDSVQFQSNPTNHSTQQADFKIYMEGQRQKRAKYFIKEQSWKYIYMSFQKLL